MADDATGRRQEIAQVVLELVARGGVQAATVRAVATAAGLSMGSVRHFFASQDELRRFTMTEVVTAIEARLAVGAEQRARCAATGSLRDAVSAAAEVCEALLPLDTPRVLEARVYAAFSAEAATDAGIAEVCDGAAGRLHDAIADVVSAMAELGALGARRDPRAETDRLWALLDGLTQHLLHHPDRLPPPRARASLRLHLVELTTPAPLEDDR